MAILNYSDMVSAVAAWLIDRTDLLSRIPDFITIAENNIYRDMDLRQMETALSLSVPAGGAATVPSNYKKLKNVYITTSPYTTLERKDAEFIYKYYSSRGATATPRFIARDGSSFIFGPAPDAAYTLAGTYYAYLTALSDANPTNWIFDNRAQDLLLFGALVEASPYLGNDARIPVWQSKYGNAQAQIMRANNEEEYSGSSIRATYNQGGMS